MAPRTAKGGAWRRCGSVRAVPEAGQSIRGSWRRWKGRETALHIGTRSLPLAARAALRAQTWVSQQGACRSVAEGPLELLVHDPRAAEARPAALRKAPTPPSTARDTGLCAVHALQVAPTASAA
eukprot:scaffold2129_cov255-Pinguiococcus_pyrenoidosus.AAC.9